MTRKIVSTIIVCLLIIGSSAFASTPKPLITKLFDGHELSATCKNLPSDCQELISVVANIMSEDGVYNALRTCIPDDVSDRKLTQQVDAWLKKNREHWSLSAFALIASAFADWYPCD